MKKLPTLIILLVLFVLEVRILVCGGFSILKVQNIKENTGRFLIEEEFQANEALHSYLHYYSLPYHNVDYRAGYVESGSYDIFVQFFDTEDSEAFVILLHGYLDHSAVNSPLITFLLENRCSVVVLDLPGHGLSSGKSADIDNFKSYGVVLQDVISEFSRYPWKKRIIMGHSTGCAVAFEYLQQTGDINSEYILISPLIRSYMWHPSRFGMALLRPFANSIFRRKGGATSDKEYEAFMLEDPLYMKSVPFHWVDELNKWQKQSKEYKPLSAKVSVYQGTADTVVDWRYNIPFLKEKLPLLNVVYIKDGYHSLQYESEPVRSGFFKKIKKQL